MKNVMAFVDEYGNNSFDFSSQGSHFIVSAILIDEDKQGDIEAEIEVIRKKYFQKGEMKSSGVGSNDQRRLIILRELIKIDFRIIQ